MQCKYCEKETDKEFCNKNCETAHTVLTRKLTQYNNKTHGYTLTNESKFPTLK